MDQGDGRDRTTIKDPERIDPDRKLEASWRALRVIEECANGLQAPSIESNTARSYVKRASEKLNANSQLHAVALAIRRRLI